jgi:hypothetical protein
MLLKRSLINPPPDRLYYWLVGHGFLRSLVDFLQDYICIEHVTRMQLVNY